jgi:hypothetical protein
MRKGAADTNLIPLNIPVPPMLAQAIGYNGDARFVSFHWTPYGDEVDYSDGRVTATGIWQAFLAYIQHPAINPYLQDYDLGSSESEAKHALILDQEQHALFVAPVREAEKFLSQQWPKEQPIRMSPEEYIAVVSKSLKHVKHPRDISMEVIHRLRNEQYALVEELQLWLDKQLKN